MSHISRRGVLTAGLALPLAASAQQNSAAPARKLKVIVTGGHPGDPEYGCGGTVARYTDQGHEVVMLYMNHGEKNCPAQPGDPGSTVRTAEAQKACQILKARPLFAGQCDAHSVVDPAHYDEFRALIESEKPDVVFTHWPIDEHRDHRAISLLTHDAWLHMKKRFVLYYYEVAEDTTMFAPVEYVDITAVESRRRAACYAHASQTPDHFYAVQVQMSQFRGAQAGYAHAEGFVRLLGSPLDRVLP